MSPAWSVGYTRGADQVGTGPFKLQSFQPGKQSVHVRHPNYWREGKPYLDQVTIIDIDDPVARINAMVAAQVDAVVDVPFAQVPIVSANKNLVLFENEGGGWLPLCMRIDVPRTTTSGSAGVPAHRRPGADRTSRLSPVMPASPTTSTASSTRPTRRICRSAPRTSRRPSRCSRTPARRA
jgi:hypothetical protein